MKKLAFIVGVAVGGALFIGGVALAAQSVFIVQQGGTGAQTFPSGNVLYGSGTNALQNEATGTITCSGCTTTAGSYVLGNNLTITVSGGGSYPFTPSTFGLLNVSATTSAIYDSGGLISGTSTIGSLTATSSITNTAVTSALVLANASGLETTYAGSNPCSGTQAAISLSATGVITCTNIPQGTVTSVTATYPIQSTGGATPIISTAFGTTTSWGIGNNGFFIAGATGIPFVAASSTLNLPFSALPNVSANSVLGNNTSASASATSIGTSSLYTLGAGLTQSSTAFKQVENRGFSYATSTAWTGTTTIPLGVGYGEVWQNMKCYTDAGTLNVDFYHATSHFITLNSFNASTTIGTITATTNTTDTVGDKVSVDIGTPATSPTKISCTVQDQN